MYTLTLGIAGSIQPIYIGLHFLMTCLLYQHNDISCTCLAGDGYMKCIILPYDSILQVSYTYETLHV